MRFNITATNAETNEIIRISIEAQDEQTAIELFETAGDQWSPPFEFPEGVEMILETIERAEA